MDALREEYWRLSTQRRGSEIDGLRDRDQGNRILSDGQLDCRTFVLELTAQLQCLRLR